MTYYTELNGCKVNLSAEECYRLGVPLPPEAVEDLLVYQDKVDGLDDAQAYLQDSHVSIDTDFLHDAMQNIRYCIKAMNKGDKKERLQDALQLLDDFELSLDRATEASSENIRKAQDAIL